MDQPTRYRKKPVEIEAFQWDGTPQGATPVINWILGHGGTARYHPEPKSIMIDTLEGSMLASPSDWIIRGVQGEFYPCRADIFAATYDESTDAET